MDNDGVSNTLLQTSLNPMRTKLAEMQLYIDSGKHSFTNEEERIDAIESKLDSPTAVFTEDSPGTVTWKEKLTSLPTAPLLIGTMLLWVHVILPVLRPIFGDDTAIENHLVEEDGVERIPADESKLEIISENSRLHLAANWLPITVSMVLWIIYGNPLLTLVVLPGVVGFSLLFTFLAITQERRDEHIAQRIRRNAGGHEEACLVVGEEHHEPVAEQLASNEAVTVVNPTLDEED